MSPRPEGCQGSETGGKWDSGTYQLEYRLPKPRLCEFISYGAPPSALARIQHTWSVDCKKLMLNAAYKFPGEITGISLRNGLFEQTKPHYSPNELTPVRLLEAEGHISPA